MRGGVDPKPEAGDLNERAEKILEIGKSLYARHKNAVLYFVIGVNASAIDLVVYLVLFNLVSWPAVVSTVISVSAATIFGFSMNIVFNFKVYDKLFLRFLSYSSVSGVGLLLSAGSLYYFHNKAGFDGNHVKVASLPVVFLTQYLLNKTISFRRSVRKNRATGSVDASNIRPDDRRDTVKKNLAIIGAGYTGLTIGYRLVKAGFDVTLYEKENTVGGLASGFRLDGLPMEKIWHFLYLGDHDALGLAEELGVLQQLTFHDSSVSTYYDGRLYPFSTPLDLMRFKPLSLWSRIRTGLVALYLRRLRNWKPLTQVTALDWMTKRAGKKATEVIWEPLLRGKFGKYHDKVIMSWLWGRISIRARSKGSTGEKLGYFKGSFSVLTDRLKEEIEKGGGKIRLGSAVESISRNEDGGIHIKAGGKSDIVQAVVATVPTGVFGELIKNNREVSAEYLEKLSAIVYIGAVVMVFTSDQKISPFYWHNINDPKIPFLVLLSNTVLTGADVYDGKNVYYVGFYAGHEHAYFSQSEDSILSEWEQGIKRMFPEFDPSQIRAKALFKFANAQHIVDLGYEDKIPGHESVVPGVYLANYSQIYPDDRGINFAVQEGNKMALLIQGKYGDL